MVPPKNLFPTLILGALLLTGCSSLRTDKQHHAAVDALVSRGDYVGALARTEAAKGRAYTYKDRVAYQLDRGMLLHWNGDYEESNELLEQAERSIDGNFTKSLSRAAASMLINDNVLEYAGEAYEDIYLNVFKALNFLALGENDRAFVEVRRIDHKIVQLENRYSKMGQELSKAEEAQTKFKPGKIRFQESALGRYLSILLYRNDGKWDDVRIDREKIERGWKLQPTICNFKGPDLSRTVTPTGPEIGRLNIIAFTGRSPDKIASTFYVHTEENLIILAGSAENYLGQQRLTGMYSLPWPDMKAGYHFKFQLPETKRRPSVVARIEATIGNQAPETLQRIESIENVAIETFRAKKPLIFLKTITRAVSKGLAAEKAKQELTENMGDGLSFIARIATDLTIDQTENADLRIARYFPAVASVHEFQVEAGTYDIQICYYDRQGLLLHCDERNGIQLEAGRLNVLESVYLN